MEFLGFEAPETVAEVGVVRQQALGFPAWALVNDPANGHHALALVKDIERLVRIAKSRIGPARDGFVELGELKGNIGDQNYDLPASVDLARYRAVTVWCKRFSVNFATAPLTSTQGAISSADTNQGGNAS